MRLSRQPLGRFQAGLSLIEVLIASVILAMIMIVVERAISSANRSAEISESRSKSLREIDRVWVLIENDLRNIIAVSRKPPFGPPEPAMLVADSDDYRLMFVRAGLANPLLIPRSEVVRVGYRIEDEILWRDAWIDPYNFDPDFARPQKILNDIEELEIKVLPRAPTAKSFSSGPWLDEWPQSQGNPVDLPLALEVIITLEKMGEMRRIILMAPGTM